jgi:hypothetical protein
MAQRDGVADGWILYEAWCKRNGGTPIRGRDGSGHVCFVGPIDQTIDPGDEGTVDIVVPGSGKLPQFEVDKLELKLRAAKLRQEEAELEFKKTTELINAVLKKAKR